MSSSFLCGWICRSHVRDEVLWLQWWGWKHTIKVSNVVRPSNQFVDRVLGLIATFRKPPGPLPSPTTKSFESPLTSPASFDHSLLAEWFESPARRAHQKEALMDPFSSCPEIMIWIVLHRSRFSLKPSSRCSRWSSVQYAQFLIESADSLTKVLEGWQHLSLPNL